MNRKLTFKIVQDYIEKEGNGCELITIEEHFNENYHKNYKFLFKCKCGEVFEKRFNSFKNSTKQCRKCGLDKGAKIRGNNQKLKYEDIKDYINGENGNGCILITSKEEFQNNYKTNTTTKLLIKCRCGQTFEKVFGSFRKGQKQCKECGRKEGYEKQKRRVIVNCYQCGKEIEIVNCDLIINHHFCSPECHNKWKSIRMTGNKLNEGRLLTDDIKKKISIANKGKLCGANNPNYKADLTQEDRENRRNIPGYRDFIKGVFERDNYTCQRCGDNKGGNLVAHHLNGYDTFKEQRTDVNNGVTLCNVCHKEFHSLYGYGNNTKEQYKEWISK